MKNRIITIGLIMSIFLCFTMSSFAVADETKTITDEEGDVYDYVEYQEAIESGDYSNLKTYDNQPNIDIKKITYSKGDISKEVTVTLEVYGEIEDSGYGEDSMSGIDDLTNDGDFDFSAFLEAMISYQISIETSEQIYTITYINTACSLIRGDVYGESEEADYEKDGSTLTVTFDLDSAAETLETIIVTSSYMKFDWDALMSGEMEDTSGMELYMDMAPNVISVSINAPSKSKTEQSVSFSAELEDGTAPFEYEWDFDDGATSTEASPTHKYSVNGTYYPSVIVTDAEGNIGTGFITIEITKDNDDPTPPTTPVNNGLLVFIALIAIVIVVGVAVVIYVMRR